MRRDALVGLGITVLVVATVIGALAGGLGFQWLYRQQPLAEPDSGELLHESGFDEQLHPEEVHELRLLSPVTVQRYRTPSPSSSRRSTGAARS